MKGKIEVPGLTEVTVDGRGKRRKAEVEVDVLESESRPATVEWGEVRLPLATGDAGYCARHVQIQLSAGEATKLKRVVLGLQATGVTIGARKELIKGAPDALRYLLTQLPD